jgi:hypothetical protein
MYSNRDIRLALFEGAREPNIAWHTSADAVKRERGPMACRPLCRTGGFCRATC